MNESESLRERIAHRDAIAEVIERFFVDTPESSALTKAKDCADAVIAAGLTTPDGAEPNQVMTERETTELLERRDWRHFAAVPETLTSEELRRLEEDLERAREVLVSHRCASSVAEMARVVAIANVYLLVWASVLDGDLPGARVLDDLEAPKAEQ